MQASASSPCLQLFKSSMSIITTTNTKFTNPIPPKLRIQCQQRSRNNNRSGKESVKVKGRKENVWSVDNEMAKAEREKERGKGRRKKRGKRERSGRGDGKVMVSGAMLMEVETVLQTQEPVIKPVWNTFASSISGIWKGVGAVFSPMTAEMEPVDLGSKNESLYDCYTLLRIESVPSPSGGPTSQIQRKINWVTLNPCGEVLQHFAGSKKSKEEIKDGTVTTPNSITGDSVLPNFESFDLEKGALMEDDAMDNEPGLVYFEDGSYSRGPVDILVGDVDDTNYYLSPTFKFEQCLVKGCHKRLRIVHTIEFSNGGSDIQIMRVAVYEEEWVSPVNLNVESNMEFDLKPFSQRKRTQPSDLTGSWKVFEVSATPVYAEEMDIEESNSAPYVYLCTENLKKRSLPESSAYFGEEEMVDTQDVTVLWLPGGVTAYVDVNKEGILCIGVGWYSNEGINLVMERDYGTDGKLKEVRWKCEVKRRWSDPVAL